MENRLLLHLSSLQLATAGTGILVQERGRLADETKAQNRLPGPGFGEAPSRFHRTVYSSWLGRDSLPASAKNYDNKCFDVTIVCSNASNIQQLR